MEANKNMNTDMTPFMNELGKNVLIENPSEAERVNGLYKAKLCVVIAKMEALRLKSKDLEDKREAARVKRFVDYSKAALEIAKRNKSVIGSVGKFVIGVLPEDDKRLKEQLEIFTKTRRLMDEIP